MLAESTLTVALTSAVDLVESVFSENSGSGISGLKYGGPIRQDRIQSSLSWSVRPSRNCMALPHSC